jgi:hypothetical protein
MVNARTSDRALPLARETGASRPRDARVAANCAPARLPSPA